jgi:glycosyltransferase involved in cell wall biosynthesis
MNAPRIALVTRRFWPLVGGAETLMSNLATELRRQGFQVTILTAQWEPDWPTEFVHREVPVLRLPNPPQRAWGTVRYMMALSRWLRLHRDQLDVVYVSMLKHDAYATIGTLRGTHCAVVLRAEGGGETGDCQWQRTGRFGTRIRRRCLEADAIVAPSEAIQQELHEAGYPHGRVHRIGNGVTVGPPRTEQHRREARRSLAEANCDLFAPYEAPVALFTGRLHEAKGLLDLIDAWRLVVQRHPTARLWLVGDGPQRGELYQRVLDHNLRDRIFLPGSFDQIDDLLNAADLFLLPSYQEGMSISLLEAMAAGLPLVASDIAGNRQLVNHDQEGLLVPPANPRALAGAILELLDRPDRAAQLAARARQRVIEQFSIQHTAALHLALFRQVIERRAAENG